MVVGDSKVVCVLHHENKWQYENSANERSLLPLPYLTVGEPHDFALSSKSFAKKMDSKIQNVPIKLGENDSNSLLISL